MAEIDLRSLPPRRTRAAQATGVPAAEPVVDLRGREARPILIIHSSDDMYGADRMVLEVVGALTDQERRRTVVWLPDDYEHGPDPLCRRLGDVGVATEHVALPVARRAYLNPAGVARVGSQVAATRRRVAELAPGDVLLATSALLPLAPFLPGRTTTQVSLHLQEVWRPGRERLAMSRLARRVDRIIAISEASRDSLPAGLHERTVVVPNGTPDPGPVRSVRDRSGPLRFVIASRWNAWKGHDVLLRAWELAGCPGHLVVLGGPPPLGASVDVVALAAVSARPASIEIRGEVPDAGAAIEQCDVMIVPSTTPEPFGLVTIEAFARGRPVIAAAHGGLLETVQDGTGWLVPPGDPARLAEVLASLTRDEVAAAGERARARFELLYSQESFRAGFRQALFPDSRDPKRSPAAASA